MSKTNFKIHPQRALLACIAFFIAIAVDFVFEPAEFGGAVTCLTAVGAMVLVYFASAFIYADKNKKAAVVVENVQKLAKDKNIEDFVETIRV